MVVVHSVIGAWIEVVLVGWGHPDYPKAAYVLVVMVDVLNLSVLGWDFDCYGFVTTELDHSAEE